jgi:hypothetical protein
VHQSDRGSTGHKDVNFPGHSAMAASVVTTMNVRVSQYPVRF